MVQEKDAELEANKQKEMKAVAQGKSLVFMAQYNKVNLQHKFYWKTDLAFHHLEAGTLKAKESK